MSYLGLTYGPEKLIEWWRRGPDSDRYYADEFERIYGMPLTKAWQDWIRWEREFQEANLKSVRTYPITPHTNIAPQGLGAISRTYLSADRSKLYGAVRYPGRVPHLVEISIGDGKVQELQEVEGAISYRVSSLAYDPASETLFYTTDNATYRNLMAFDLRTNTPRMLLKAARIGDLAFNPVDRSLWGLRTNNGFAVLVRIPFPYTEWQNVHVFPFAEVPFDLDVSPDGTLVSMSVAGPDEQKPGTQVMQVRVMRTDALLAGNATPERRFVFGTAVPEGFVFSRDGRYLYGSSFYTGVSNIYRYELATGKLEALSNAEVGFFHPVELDESKLVVLNYTAQGFVPATIEPKVTEDLSAITFLGEQIATKRPVVQGWLAGSPGTVDYQSQVTRQGSYSPLRELGLESVYPVLQGYKDSVSYGLHARFSDPVGFDTLALTAGYSPDDSLPGKERGHAEAKFQHAMWTGGLRWNAADFYDLFGPTKVSRAGYSGYVGYDRPIIYDLPEKMNLKVHAAYYGDMDTLPAFQNVASPFTSMATAIVDRQRGRRDRPRLGHRHSPVSRGRRAHPEPARKVRRGIPAAPRPFLDLVAELGRHFLREPGQPALERVLRRFRQQLRGPRRPEALPGSPEHARLRDRRARWQGVRQVHPRVEPAAAAIRVAGYAGVLRELGAAGGVRERAGAGPAGRRLPEWCVRRGCAARFPAAGPAPAPDDALLRLRCRLRGRRQRQGRVHGVPQDPVTSGRRRVRAG
jgi:hypothetical protein